MPLRSPEIASLPNLRDIGGYQTRDGGRVRAGLLYRSNDLGRLTEKDLATLAGLGIRSVYDFRTSAERTRRPDRLPRGAAYVAMDLLADSSEKRPDEFMAVFGDPEATRNVLGNGGGDAFFMRSYREMVLIASARSGYGRFFSDLARGDCLPALMHCTGGKDRTGWAAAALLLLLGVPEEQVLEDYLLTNERLRGMFRALADEFSSRGGDPALFEPFVTARPEYLASALDAMRGTYGTIERYFADGLNVDGTAQAALRAIFVERP